MKKNVFEIEKMPFIWPSKFFRFKVPAIETLIVEHSVPMLTIDTVVCIDTRILLTHFAVEILVFNSTLTYPSVIYMAQSAI